MSYFSARRFAPERAAVVIIDIQNDFCSPNGPFFSSGDAPNHAPMESTVDRILRLIDGARRVGTPVIHVRTTHDGSTNSQAWLTRRGDLDAGAPVPRQLVSTGSWGAEFYRVKPLDKEPIVTKHRYSSFIGTNLDVILRSAGIESLLFAGVQTHVCVETSAREALNRDYHVTLVADCCGTVDPSDHTRMIETDVISSNFGVVATLEQVLGVWEQFAAEEGIATTRSHEMPANAPS